MASPSKKCQVCQKPTTLRCIGCGDMDDVGSSYCCGTECQTLDCVEHKPKCSPVLNRKIIKRISEFARKFFFLMTEMLYDNFITKMTENEKGELWFHHGEMDPRLSIAFIPFPSRKVVQENNQRHALISICSCDMSLKWTHDILEYLRLGRAKDIQELQLTIQNRPRPAFYAGYGQKDETLYPQRILQITAKHGKVLALDLTDAQYGYHAGAVTDWDDYVTARKPKIENEYHFGNVKWLDFDQIAGPAERPSILALQLEAINLASQLVKNWKNEVNVGISGLLRHTKWKFEAAEAKVLEEVQQSTAGYLADLHNPMNGPLTLFKGMSILPSKNAGVSNAGVNIARMKPKRKRMQDIVKEYNKTKSASQVVRRPNGYATYFL